MNLLLDTHVLLWWLSAAPTLSEKARKAVSDGRNLVYVSAASIWEIRIKQKLGKLKIPDHFFQVFDQQDFEKLAITAEHAYAVGDLPFIHRDPFDRMLIAQARIEKLSVITHKKIFTKYPVQVIAA